MRSALDQRRFLAAGAATGAALSVTTGAIFLQSEGAPIEFRDIVLTPLKKEHA
jgi:hypothetical protein